MDDKYISAAEIVFQQHFCAEVQKLLHVWQAGGQTREKGAMQFNASVASCREYFTANGCGVEIEKKAGRVKERESQMTIFQGLCSSFVHSTPASDTRKPRVRVSFLSEIGRASCRERV